MSRNKGKYEKKKKCGVLSVMCPTFTHSGRALYTILINVGVCIYQRGTCKSELNGEASKGI